jgi:hypothetical protein
VFWAEMLCSLCVSWSLLQADLIATPLQAAPQPGQDNAVSELDLTANDTADVIQVDVDVPVFSPVASADTVHTASSQSVVLPPVTDAIAPKPDPPVLVAEQSTITEPVAVAAPSVTEPDTVSS